MKKLFWIPLAATAALVSGCGSNPPTATNDSPATNGSIASNNLPAQPRTGTTSQLPTEPKEVVRLFLDSMRQGNGTQLAALLSTAAREEITRKKLEIDPLGSPLATFQIGEAGTHPEQPDSMLVSTVWSEPAQNGQPEANLDVVWALRKEATGWRICEMAVDPMNGEDVQIVNFEHLEPEQPAPQEQRVASLPNAPASFPAAANGQQFQQPPQQPIQQFQPTNQPQYLPGGTAPSFQPNALPAIVPSSGQLPPAQPSGSFTLPPANGTLPPANSGNFPTNPSPYSSPK